MHSGWELARESENSVWDCYFVTKIEKSHIFENIRKHLTYFKLFKIVNCVQRHKFS
jgi:hypothetical protein